MFTGDRIEIHYKGYVNVPRGLRGRRARIVGVLGADLLVDLDSPVTLSTAHRECVDVFEGEIPLRTTTTRVRVPADAVEVS